MGKTFVGKPRKTAGGEKKWLGSDNSGNLENSGNSGYPNGSALENRSGCSLNGDLGRYRNSYEFEAGDLVGTLANGDERESNGIINGINRGKCNLGLENVGNDSDSYEVWCICRLLKPCKSCEDRRKSERENTPTPTGDLFASGEVNGCASTSKSATTTPTAEEKVFLEHICDIVNGSAAPESKTKTQHKNSSCNHSRESSTSRKHCPPAKRGSSALDSSVHYTETSKGLNNSTSSGETYPNNSVEKNDLGLDIGELFEKIDKLNAAEDDDNLSQGDSVRLAYKDLEPSIADTPPGSPTITMDTASTCSFDHFDFDTSFCSLKTTDMMEHGDLAEQLTMVQQMVVEMKTGFARAMEELSKIQYGDQTLQQQLADNTKQCTDEITTVKQTVDELKTEMVRISETLHEVSETQRGLQDRLDSFQTDRDMLLQELEQNGTISDQIRLRLSGNVEDNNNTIPPDVAPMVHPYLNSLRNHHQHGPDEYNSDSSLTAAVSRSLNLTQALGQKCLNLDMSTTSSDEEEDNSRNSRSGSGHRTTKRKSNFSLEEGQGRASQKIPPHERVLDEVHREEAVRDIVDTEHEYCGQLWSLLEDYIHPLRDETIMGRRDLAQLFPAYIPQLYEQHCILLRKMEERIKKWKSGGVIGDVFAKFTESQDGDGLMIYKDFINDFPTIIHTINKWFAHSQHFRDLMQSPCLANSPILQLLLAPLQQVPKYSILLKNVLKHTPVDHPDRYYLESSLTRLKHFLNSMNEDLEHAMQAINMNNAQVNRTRETGNSARSKSSASSGEVNHVSRDSGVHSNEEERAKSPMSPNSSRRYLLQQLREKREKRLAAERQDGRPPTPKGRKLPGYGSHPDLSNQKGNHPAEGRMSPYQAPLSQAKLFSSLSKLPMPQENSNSLRSRSRKMPDIQGQGHRHSINTNYLRPLTPQVLPSSVSAYSMEHAKRREEHGERMRQRPASALEFSYGGRMENPDDYMEMLAHQHGLPISPPHSSSSDRSRRDMQQSLNKLLAETGNHQDEFSDQDQEDGPYHRPYQTTKERFLRHQEKNRVSDGLHDDFGIYGDEDDDNDIDDTQQEVQPMKLLQDSHRPKIMVPKWRQSASPQPPSYNNSVSSIHKSSSSVGNATEANLAASLAQSLLESPKQVLVPKDKRSIPVARELFESSGEPVMSKSSLKRKNPGNRMDSPTKSMIRQSPVQDVFNGGPVSKSLSFDTNSAPNRPANLTLNNPLNSASSLNSTKSGSFNSQGSGQNSVSTDTKRNSVTKLADVIAFTTDCLEKSDVRNMQAANIKDNENDSDTRRTLPEVPTGKMTVSDILADGNMKVSSVDTNCSSTEHTGDESEKTPENDSPERGATSPTNTNSVVYYFQNRDKINQDTMNGQTPSPSHDARSPTFIPVSLNKISTPIHEHKQYSGPHVSSPSDMFGSFTKKEKGRMVRGEEPRNDMSGKMPSENNKVASSENEVSDQDNTEVPTKERVLKAVDQLRLSFERKRQITEERRQQSQIQTSNSSTLPRPTASSPTSGIPIQKNFNDISKSARAQEKKETILRTFSAPPQQQNGPESPESPTTPEASEQKHGLYKKASHSSKFQSEPAASARQIQKLERATSPTGRSQSPNNLISSYEKFKSQVEPSNLNRVTSVPSSPQKHLPDMSLIPKRSKSPTRASMERERPKSTTDFTIMKANEVRESQGLKSAMKDTKIPVMKKSSSGQLSKSSEDISKIKKKSALKDKFSNFFGRKKNKKQKSSNYTRNGYDPDEEYNNHVVTLETEASFQRSADDMDSGFFPLTSARRSNSLSHIIQSYHFNGDDENDDDEVSAV